MTVSAVPWAWASARHAKTNTHIMPATNALFMSDFSLICAFTRLRGGAYHKRQRELPGSLDDGVEIQIVGAEELAFLDGLPATTRRTTIQRMIKLQPAMLIIPNAYDCCKKASCFRSWIIQESCRSSRMERSTPRTPRHSEGSSTRERRSSRWSGSKVKTF